MKKVLVLFAGLTGLTALYACNNNDDTIVTPPVNTPARLAATLSQPTSSTGSSTTTIASGSFGAMVDQTANAMSYTVTFSGVTPSNITLDPTSTTATGAPTSITLGAPGSASFTSPYSGSASVSSTQATGLVSGLYQVNVRAGTSTTAVLSGAVSRQP
jgi:hypothetical protein